MRIDGESIDEYLLRSQEDLPGSRHSKAGLGIYIHAKWDECLVLDMIEQYPFGYHNTPYVYGGSAHK